MSSIFNRLFGNNKVQTKKAEKEIQITRTPECDQIQALSIELQRLQEKQHYVARSEYQAIVPKYRKAVEFFKVLEKSGMLPDFCVKNRLISSQVSKTISSFESLEKEVERINDEYISEKLVSEKEYLDNILKSVDPVIQLDEDQRKVVLTDEDYCLVIAGAGAGKTTTVAAKVKYLVERQNIDPKDILVISFTNKAVGELRDKINKDLQIDCPIATFHSTGNAILHINNPEQLNIVDGSKLYFLLQDYFRKSLLTNETLVNNLIMFFASYFDAPYEGDDLHFKYIIVDEYQDISKQRFDLTKALSEVTDAKIIAVGDDWQSIYAFSGSDITLFTNFAEKMGYAKQLKIVRTYRNSQEVIDIAGNFIQRNPSQIEKRLLSPKNITDPVIIYTYDSTLKRPGDSWRTGTMYSTALAVEMALEQIMQYNRAAGKEDDGKILLLGRYSFDGDYLERSGLFETRKKGTKLKSVKYPNLDITFMTVHMSKGLGYDNVIVVNGRNETYGFPAKIEDDPVLSYVVKEDHSLDYAEERRLFYVAMTRTKNRVFFIAPEQNPSEFLLEIKRDYKNVVLKGEWNDEEIKYSLAKKTCPICGYPMQLRYKRAYGLRLYICTNEPEICGFMTNDMRAGKLAITKCDKCVSGYLIAKSSAENGYFLGCTNYKANQQGCNNTISQNDYYLMMNLSQEPAPAVERKKPVSRMVVKKGEVSKAQLQNRKTEEPESQQNNELLFTNISNAVSGEQLL